MAMQWALGYRDAAPLKLRCSPGTWPTRIKHVREQPYVFKTRLQGTMRRRSLSGAEATLVPIA